jgi:transposase-like protein
LSRSNDPVPVETRLQLVLAVLDHEMTVAEAARRHGVSAESINRWRNRFVDAGKAAMEDGMPGKAGSRGSRAAGREVRRPGRHSGAHLPPPPGHAPKRRRAGEGAVADAGR